MNSSVFNTEHLNELLSCFYVVNVIDHDNISEAAEYLFQVFNDGITVTGAEMTQEMIQAISHNSMDAFRYKYCEAPFLLIRFDKEDALKSAFPYQLAYIMAVRHYKKLYTVVLSEDRLASYGITNESLKGFTKPFTQIR